MSAASYVGTRKSYLLHFVKCFSRLEHLHTIPHVTAAIKWWEKSDQTCRAGCRGGMSSCNKSAGLPGVHIYQNASYYSPFSAALNSMRYFLEAKAFFFSAEKFPPLGIPFQKTFVFTSSAYQSLFLELSVFIWPLCSTACVSLSAHLAGFWGFYCELTGELA